MMGQTINGRHWLAAALRKHQINHTLIDNAFVGIDGFADTRITADRLKVERIHTRLDAMAERYCSVIRHFKLCYHWSIMQAEYATDIVFILSCFQSYTYNPFKSCEIINSLGIIF